MKDICVQCGESREAIKRNELACCIMSCSEDGCEPSYEFNRHRFKPYSKKELETMEKRYKEEDY